MLYLNALSYYDENNNFRLKEVLVSDGKVTYSLSPEGGFEVSEPYPFNLVSLVESQNSNTSYPVLGFNATRTYDDDDAYALALYMSSKFSALGNVGPQEEKAIFDVLEGFGNGK